MRALGALAVSFALPALGLALALAFVFAFLELKSIAISGLRFWGHIAVLGEEMSNQGLKRALVKSGSSLPKTDVVFELGPTAEGSDKHVDSGKFGDVVAGSLKKFVVTGSVAIEIAELVELRKGCSNSGLGGGDFVVRDRAESSVDFFDQVERRQRTNAETMFGIYIFQRDLTDTGEDRGVEIRLRSFLHLKSMSFKDLGRNRGGGCGLRAVHSRGSKFRVVGEIRGCWRGCFLGVFQSASNATK